MKPLNVVFSLLFLTINSLNAKEAIKEAFMEGINETIKVIEYEKLSQSKPIPEGYCIQLKAKNRSLRDNEIIKMESLALYFKLEPIFLKAQDEKKLCLSIAKDEITAKNIVKKLKKDYPRITHYIIKVEVLSFLNFHREVPALGLVGEDFVSSASTPKILKLENDVVFKTKDIMIKDSDIKNLYTIEVR